jgi:Phycobilisome protein
MNNISQVFSQPATTGTIENLDVLMSQDISLPNTKNPVAASLSMGTSSFTVSWAKKYYNTVEAREKQKLPQITQTPELTNFAENRAKIFDKLSDKLKTAIEIAWNNVEALLGEQIAQYAIDPKSIDSKEIAADTRNLYSKAIDAYGDREPVFRLSVLVGKDIIEVRRKYAQKNPLLLGFVTLEFHYTAKILLGYLSETERSQFVPYLKIIDDYLHIPYGEINLAAANLAPNSKALSAVQHLLSHTTQIAGAVYEKAISHHQGYRSSSGYLTDPAVKNSGIRDVEIFQNYLCWCVLEGSIRPVQQELFPVCLILYPKLHVSWDLVQDMLLILFWEISDRLPAEDVMIFLPYLRTVTEMFSSEVFEN